MLVKKVGNDSYPRIRGYSNFISNYLQRHNIKDIKKYLYPSIKDMYGWKMVDNLLDAVELTYIHLEHGHNILIFGDMDVDGVTSTTILYKTLSTFKDLSESNIYIKLPTREEGYGMNLSVIKNIISRKHIDLVITVDNGIKSIDEIDFLRKKNIDVIVLDHHTPDEKNLPDPNILVDLHLSNSKYPFKELAGCGLAMKFAMGMYERMNMTGFYELFEYAAIGTIADCVSLTDENRTIVKLGLEVLNKTPSIGIKALLEVLSHEGEVTSADIAFLIAPCINAPGRIYTPQLAFDLLNLDNYDEALKVANRIKELNEYRKILVDNFYSEAKKQIQNIRDDKVYVIKLDNCPDGIIGLIAGNITSDYNRPSICFTDTGYSLKGSCRSVKEFDIDKCLDACKEHIAKYGGHPLAAGLIIKEDSFNKFKNAVLTYADSSNYIVQECYTEIEDIIDTKDIQNIYNDLKLLEPFGTDNEKPLFMTEFICKINPYIDKHYSILKEKHVRLYGLDKIDIIFFDKATEYLNLDIPPILYTVFAIGENTYNNTTKLQLLGKYFSIEDPLNSTC